jgi:hypothetical protein
MEVLRRKFPYILNVQRAVQDISNQGNDIYVNADNVPLPELLRDFTAFATGNEAEENLAAAIDACCEAWTSLANTQAITS